SCIVTQPSHTYTLSLHDALPIFNDERRPLHLARNTAHHRLDPSFKEMLHWHRPGYAFKIAQPGESSLFNSPVNRLEAFDETVGRSEEHTSELQSLRHLVCRLLLE